MSKLEGRRLTTAQAARLLDSIFPMLGFLHRLKERTDKGGFDPSGDFSRAVERAHDAIHNLRVVLHYESCSRGTGRPTKEK